MINNTQSSVPRSSKQMWQLKCRLRGIVSVPRSGFKTFACYRAENNTWNQGLSNGLKIYQVYSSKSAHQKNCARLGGNEKADRLQRYSSGGQIRSAKTHSNFTMSNILPSQMALNIECQKFLVASNCTTRDVAAMIYKIAREKIPSHEILRSGKSGKLEINYQCGILLISPSEQKLNRLWRWDIHLIPNTIEKKSA